MPPRFLRWLAGAGLVLGLLTLLRSRLCRLCGCRQELITIAAPTVGATVTSPLVVSGWGQATQHNQLAIEVRDSTNAVVGAGVASIASALGQPGPFTGTVTFIAGPAGTPGHVQVFDSSPATGAITHLASALVRF